MSQLHGLRQVNGSEKTREDQLVYEQDRRSRVSPLISPRYEEKPIQMDLTPAAYFS